MQIYVINLKRRPDRLAKIDAGLAALGLPYTRINAVDGADISSPAGNPLPDAAYACYLSHIKTYRAFLETKDSHCVIMEDDVALSPRRPEALSARCFYTDQNAIVRLERPTNYYWSDPCFNKPFAVASQNRLATYALLTKSLGTGAFVISRQVAEAVVQQQPNPEVPIDVRLFNQRHTGHLGFKILQFSPALALQRLHYDGIKDSDIPFVISPKSHPLLQNMAINLKLAFAGLAYIIGLSRRFPFADK
ncbi:MAG TPA: glycosyltransferase family 25 protein [Rhodobacteraceae bacterium]|nr:glycosyltransferase family 25 protein [Paracoccaceae bacterium]